MNNNDNRPGRADHRCDVFISYRRDGGDMTAMHFYQALKSRGYNVFFDLEVLRTGRFNEALLKFIESCNDFVLILSPHALDRCNSEGDWVRREIAEALRLKKNIVPVMMKGFVFPETLPEDIEDIRFQNGLSSSSEYFEESMNRLCERYLHSRPAPEKSRKALHPLVPVLAVVAVLALGFGAYMALRPTEREVVPEIIEIIQLTPQPSPMATMETEAEAEGTDAAPAEAAAEPTQTPAEAPGPATLRDTDFPLLSPSLDVVEDSGSSTEAINLMDLRNSHVLGHPTLCRQDIASVTFLSSLEDAPEDAWDVSAEGDGLVLAWAAPNDGLYDLTIAGDGGVRIDDSDGKSRMFAGYVNVRTINFNNCVDLSRRHDFIYSFRDCTSLVSIDFSGVCTDRAVDMSHMFENCTSLKALDLSGFSTGKLEYLSNMFTNCSDLETLDISGLMTGRIEDFTGMFAKCASLKALDLGNMDTSVGWLFDDMFNGCTGLETLDVSGFNTGRATSMVRMFQECQELDTLDLSGFDTSRVTNMREMFANCQSLDALDISGFDTGRVEDMSGMFSMCVNLAKLDVKRFDTARVTSMARMFEYCSKLDGLDLTGWNTANVTTMEGMFQLCYSLYRLDLSGFDTSKLENTAYMFENCFSMVEANTTGWDVSAIKHMDCMFERCMALETIGRDPATLLHGTTQGAFDYCDKLEGLVPTPEPKGMLTVIPDNTPAPDEDDEE